MVHVVCNYAMHKCLFCPIETIACVSLNKIICQSLSHLYIMCNCFYKSPPTFELFISLSVCVGVFVCVVCTVLKIR